MVRSALLFILLAHGAQSLSCFCRISMCEDLNSLKQQCKGGLVYDECHCCKTCAKVEGETCGGLWGFEGTCDQGLFCKGGHPWRMTKGICALKTATIPTRTVAKISEERTKPTEEIEYSSGEDETELSTLKSYPTEEREIPTSSYNDNKSPTTLEKILTTTEISYSGDEGGDDEVPMEKRTSTTWAWLPTLKSKPTVQTTKETEIPTSSEHDENENIEI